MIAEHETTLARCAEVAHEANRIYCEATGDRSQVPWAQAPAWQRESAINGVRVALRGASPAQQHAAWSADKVAAGWVYGATKDADAKTHPCLVPYAELPEQQRRKDGLYIAVVRGMACALDAAMPECAPPSGPAPEMRERYGRAAFEAYNVAVGGLTWDGKPIPGWEAVTDKVREGWRVAAMAAVDAAVFEGVLP